MYLSMFEWGSRGAGDRGVSHVLGVVLLAGAVIVGAFLLVQAGQQTIGDVNDDANIELAEEVMLSVDQSFQRPDSDESVEVPDRVRSSVSVSTNATYNLTLNDRPACTTGNRSLQTIQYQKNGKEVGYQGGGVWRMTESGATMSSPPAVSYDRGALSLSFANISGQHIEGSSVSVRSNATNRRSHEAALQMALFTDASYRDARTGAASSPTQACLPTQVTNATLTINNSTYARAWADWARSSYDDAYVDVTPSSVEPGDKVHIRFALGDVSDSQFEVDNVTVKPDPSASGQAVVTATVTNAGGLKDTQDITLKHNQSGSPSEVTETVTLVGGDSTTISRSIDVTDAKPHNFTVESDQDTAYKVIEYAAVPGAPSLDITGNAIPATARLNQVPSSTVEVTNTGEMTADQQVVFLVNGSVNATQNVMVDPGESKTLDFGPSMPTDEKGTYDIAVETDDDSYSQYSAAGHYFVVGDAGVFEIAAVSPPGGLDGGDSAVVTATIENTGDIRKSAAVEIRIEDDSGTVTSKTAPLDLDGTRSGAETATVQTDPITVASGKRYNYTVETPDDTVNGTFTVGATAPPRYEITEVNVDNPTKPGERTDVNFTVTNTGGTEGDQTVQIDREGTTVFKKPGEELTPGERKTYETTLTAPDTAGKYRVTFSTRNRSLWRTLNVQPDSYLEDGGSGVTTTRAVNASIELKGAELEGLTADCYYCERKIIHAPVQMSLFVENSSGQHRVPLWRGYENGDVNGPYAERRLVDGSYENPYSYTGSFEKGSDVSVFARSYTCSHEGFTETDIRLSGYRTEACTDWGSVRIPVSNEQNSGNLVVLDDGDQLPAFQQAAWYQRGIDDMLGARLNDTGHLQLADGERAFLYELSRQNADPERASNPEDPDYNDAVVLFKVNSLENQVRTGPQYRIVDVDAPSSVSRNTESTADVTLKNVGDKRGRAELNATLDGTEADTGAAYLDPNQTKQIELDLGTKNVGTSGSYGYNVSVNGTSERWGGSIYVGAPPAEYMQVDSVQAPTTIDNGDSTTATVKLSNVGGQVGDADISLYVKDTTAASPSYYEAAATDEDDMSPGETRTVTFDMPTDRGTYTYYVETSDSTSATQAFFVGKSDFKVNDTQSVNIGAKTYNTSELIERRGGAQRMTVEVYNEGTVGDDREVTLTIQNKSDGSVVYTGDTMVTGGSGDLRGVGKYPAWAGYDVDLDPGYYTYTVTVYNETTGERVDDSATGELYLKKVDESGATGNNSPITIDADSVTLGD